MSDSHKPKLQLRKYQKDIVDAIGNENVIIKMPTGSGKTFIAAEFIKRHYCEGSTRAALFLVPACDLVGQQKRALKDWIGECDVAEYMGGATCPGRSFDVLVSTPQAFLTLQQTKVTLFTWSNFWLCVFDEVHHVLKQHPYRIIAHSIKDWTERNHHRTIQTIGLSASLTYAFGQKEVESALRSLCYDLSATKMISPTQDELISGGYVPSDDKIETMERPWQVPNGVVQENQRKPHLVHDTFMQRIRDNATTPFALMVYKVVRAIEDEVISKCSCFVSPLGKNKKLNSWEEYAHRLSIDAVIGSSIQVVCQFLEVWYVALRMIVQSWEEEQQLVFLWLAECNSGLQKQQWFGPRLKDSLDNISRLFDSDELQSEKLNSLKESLVQKRMLKGISFRCICFVKKRIDAYILSKHINNDARCREYGIRTGFVAARKSRITPSIKLTPGEASRCIEQFRSGDINVLVATSVIEEGFDVPAANVVVSYDHLKDTVELAQRFGRARQISSSLSLMEERKDRPLSALKDVKKQQDDIIKAFDPSKSEHLARREEQSQKDRHRAAFSSLLTDIKRCESSPLEVLNMHAAKTKAVAKLEYIEAGPDKIFRCKISYSNQLLAIDGKGEGTTKKQSQHQAAANILNQLRERGRKEYGL